MNPLLWWVIFVCLIVLITVLSLYLCYSVFAKNSDSNNSPTPSTSDFIRLNKYNFESMDVEDLTNIEKNYQKFNSKISFVNEVEPKLSFSQPSSPRVLRGRKASLLPDIHESSDCFGSAYSVEDIMNEVSSEKGSRRASELLPRKFSVVTEGMRKNSLVSISRKFSFKPDNTDDSTDTLDCVDPINVETLRSIALVEDDVHKIDYEINYFLGEVKNLKYYEINEKLIRLNLALSDIQCSNDELRKRKKEVQLYISQCKEKLNRKIA